jgi:hypothetical protein
MESGGFEYVTKTPQVKDSAEPRRGGKAAISRGGQYPRGGRGGARPVRLDADGNKIGAGSNQRERVPFAGKPREEGHPMDRQSGMGRGRKPVVKRDGQGKFNVGHTGDVAYKKKTDGEPAEEGEVEEQKEEEPKVEEPKVVIKEEVIGISMEDFFANRQKGTGRKEGREAEGVKGAKTEANTAQKVHQATVLQNQYLKGPMAKTADVAVA